MSLIIIAVILLAANIILQNYLVESGNDEVIVDENELSQRFKNILTEFGIEDKLIKETKSVDKRSNQRNFELQSSGSERSFDSRNLTGTLSSHSEKIVLL